MIKPELKAFCSWRNGGTELGTARGQRRMSHTPSRSSEAEVRAFMHLLVPGFKPFKFSAASWTHLNLLRVAFKALGSSGL